jgi:hypothetical protein
MPHNVPRVSLVLRLPASQRQDPEPFRPGDIDFDQAGIPYLPGYCRVIQASPLCPKPQLQRKSWTVKHKKRKQERQVNDRC